MLKLRLLFLLAPLVWLTSTYAKPECELLLNPEMERTAGAEREFSQNQKLGISDAIKFQETHALVSKNEQGLWIAGRIPHKLLKTLFPDAEPASFAAKTPVRIGLSLVDEPRYEIVLEPGDDDSFYLTNWGKLRSPHLERLLTRIFQARGQYNSDLRMAVNHEFLNNLPHFLSEEWSQNEFVGFEYSMRGGVPTIAEAIHWSTVLRRRIIQPDPTMGANLDRAEHIHILYNISSLPNANDRANGYRDVANLWGDLNDLEFVYEKWLLTQSVLKSTRGKEPIFNTGFKKLTDRLGKTSFRVLTRGLFESITPTTNGLELLPAKTGVHEISYDDTNFPAEFKFLTVGLRGIYDQDEVSGWRAVEKVGLELRGFTSNRKAAQLIFPRPSDVVDHIPRLSRDRSLPRGLAVDSEAAMVAAGGGMLKPKFVGYLVKALKSYRIADSKRRKWNTDQLIAYIFWPLSRMIDAPVMQAALLRLPKEERAIAIEFERLRFGGYLASLGQLQSAWDTQRYDRTYGEHFLKTVSDAALRYSIAYNMFFVGRKLSDYYQYR